MKQYEIYWNDLNEEAKKRLAGLYDENVEIDTIPLAVIDIEEEVVNAKIESTKF